MTDREWPTSADKRYEREEDVPSRNAAEAPASAGATEQAGEPVRVETTEPAGAQERTGTPESAAAERSDAPDALGGEWTAGAREAAEALSSADAADETDGENAPGVPGAEPLDGGGVPLDADDEPLDAEHEPLEADDEPLDEGALNAMIEEICNSKAEEFHMIGYESVTGKDVWDCVSSKYKTLPPLHKIVNDILSLRPTGLMNWMTLSVWKQSERGR